MFVEVHKDRRTEAGLRWGVEPICAVLSEHGIKIAYYDARGRGPSRRALRDDGLK